MGHNSISELALEVLCTPGQKVLANLAIEETATIILETLRERDELHRLTRPPPRIL